MHTEPAATTTDSSRRVYWFRVRDISAHGNQSALSNVFPVLGQSTRSRLRRLKGAQEDARSTESLPPSSPVASASSRAENSLPASDQLGSWRTTHTTSPGVWSRAASRPSSIGFPDSVPPCGCLRPNRHQIGNTVPDLFTIRISSSDETQTEMPPLTTLISTAPLASASVSIRK